VLVSVIVIFGVLKNLSIVCAIAPLTTPCAAGYSGCRGVTAIGCQWVSFSV